MARLRDGYYAEPSGFISWEEHQEQVKAEDLKKRLARILAAKKQQFELGFQVWLEETPQSQLLEHLAGSVFDNPRSLGAQGELKRIFAEQTGQEAMPLA